MRRILIAISTVGLFAVMAGPAAQAESSSDNAAICAANNANYTPQRRISACSTLIETLTDQPRALAAALVNRAAVSWRVGESDIALTDLDRAIALDPNNEAAFRERSNTYRAMGRLDSAIADASQALSLNPNDFEALKARGYAFDKNGQYDSSIADFSAALRLKPDDSMTYMDRGVEYYAKQDYQTAIRDFDQAIKLDPKNARAFSNRGAAQKALGHFDQSIADDNTAIKLDPKEPEFYDNRGLNLAAKGDYDHAIPDYDQAINLRPEADFLANRGDAYEAKGVYDRAIADYNRAIALDANFLHAYNNRGAVYQKTGDFDRAIADYQAALRIDPQSDTAAWNLADARRQRDSGSKPGTAATVSKVTLPSFDCATATRAAEKAICSDPDLARLDTEIDAAYKAALAARSGKAATQLRQEERDFIAARNTSFGNPSYNLRHEMEARLAVLRGSSASLSR